MPETLDGLDQRGLIGGGAGAYVPYAEWRQAQDRALAALEIPGIVVVLGPADLGTFFLRDLMVGLRERGRAVTFVSRANLVRWWPADSALVIEDAAPIDAVRLEAICRPPGRRIVLAGLPASALAELPAPLTPAPLTVVNLEPLSPGTAAAPRSTSGSNARKSIASFVLAATGVFDTRMTIASGVLAAISVAGALLWTNAPSAPPAPAPSRVAALQPAIELPPEPARSASEQLGDATSAASPALRPAGDEARPGMGTSLELPPAVPVVAQTEPRSNSEPAPPRLQAGPPPEPESRQALNVPHAAAIAMPPLDEAPRATPPEQAAPSGNAPQLLPDNAPIRVLVSYAPRSAAARQEAAELVRLLRGGGLSASDPAPAARVAGKAGITYFFAEDRDGATRVEHDLGEGFGPSRLSPPAPGEPFPRPGTIEVLVSAR